MKDLGELVDKFCDQNNIYRFEGESGLENLEKLIKAIGYESCYFRYGTLLEVFLCDNPGAITALIEWIADTNNKEWAELLTNKTVK